MKLSYLIVIILVMMSVICLWKTKENYTSEAGDPDPCVHMMETGFSNQTIELCKNYANRCGDVCEPYPVTTQKVTELYNKYGVGLGEPPSAKVDLAVRTDLMHASCIPNLGPGDKCVAGEEECQSTYVCKQGKCQCPSMFDVYT